MSNQNDKAVECNPNKKKKSGGWNLLEVITADHGTGEKA